MKKYITISLLTLFLVSCAKRTVPVTTSLAQAIDAVAQADSVFQATAAQAVSNGLISPAEDIQLQVDVKTVAQVDNDLALAESQYLAGTPGWQNTIQTAVTLAQNLDAQNLDFIKDPNTKVLLKTLLNTLLQAVNAVSQALANPTPVPPAPPIARVK